jgi:hypothetical protein
MTSTCELPLMMAERRQLEAGRREGGEFGEVVGGAETGRVSVKKVSVKRREGCQSRWRCFLCLLESGSSHPDPITVDPAIDKMGPHSRALTISRRLFGALQGSSPL